MYRKRQSQSRYKQCGRNSNAYNYARFTKQKVVFLCMPKKAFIAFRKNSVSYFLTGVCSTGGHLTYSMVISPLYKRFTISNHIKAPTMRILSTC